MHGILGDFALQSEFIFLFELCRILGIILCKFEVGFCCFFVSAHGLSDFLFECFEVFVAIGYNRVCFFNFISFLARIEREFEVVRLGAAELEIVDLVLHFLMLLLAEGEFFLLFRLEREDFLIDIRAEFEF